jgi:hypothetical protein
MNEVGSLNWCTGEFFLGTTILKPMWLFHQGFYMKTANGFTFCGCRDFWFIGVFLANGFQ